MQTIKLTRQAPLLFIFLAAFAIYGCNTSSGNDEGLQQPLPQSLPVITLSAVPATTYQEFSASLEGSKDIEIRPQVEGYLDTVAARFTFSMQAGKRISAPTTASQQRLQRDVA